MKHFTLLFLLFVLGSSSKTRHPYYISVTEIRSDARLQTYNMSCRMFTDDLQNALYQLYGYRADLEKNDLKHDPWLQKYIGEHLQIKVGGQLVSFRFTGYETEEEATWCYLEATSFPGDGSAEVRNRLLYDFLSEQTNMIHYYRNGQRSSFKLVNPDAIAKF